MEIDAKKWPNDPNGDASSAYYKVDFLYIGFMMVNHNGFIVFLWA